MGECADADTWRVLIPLVLSCLRRVCVACFVVREVSLEREAWKRIIGEAARRVLRVNNMQAKSLLVHHQLNLF